MAPDSLNIGGFNTSTGIGYVSAFDGMHDGYGPDSYTYIAGGGGSGTNTINSGFSDYVGLGNVTIHMMGNTNPTWVGDPGLSLIPWVTSAARSTVVPTAI